MKKAALTLIALSFSLSSMAASIITCSGQSTKSAIYLGLTGQAFPLNQADYIYNNKILPTDGHEFGIQIDKTTQVQKLTYKFKTLKRHALAKKNSHLILSIKQISAETDAFIFILNDTHEAELKLQTEEGIVVLDKLNCQGA